MLFFVASYLFYNYCILLLLFPLPTLTNKFSLSFILYLTNLTFSPKITLLFFKTLVHRMSFRSSRFLLFFICHEFIIIALYFQYVDHLEPCPLCIFQRLVFAAMAVLFLVAALHNPKANGRKYYNVITLLVDLAGVWIAATHVWLQHLPKDQVPTCGPGFNYLLDNLPFWEFIDHVLRGSGECAEVNWRLMGFTMPELTLFIYILFALYLGWASWAGFKRTSWYIPVLLEDA